MDMIGKHQRLLLLSASLFVVGFVYFGAFSSLDTPSLLKVYLMTLPLQGGAIAAWRRRNAPRSALRSSYQPPHRSRLG
jgi:hypothetical protein